MEKSDDLARRWNELAEVVKNFASLPEDDPLYRVAQELHQSLLYADKMSPALLQFRAFYLQNWLHYGVQAGRDHSVNAVRHVALLVQNAISPQLRATFPDMLASLEALAHSHSQASRVAARVVYCVEDYPQYNSSRASLVDLTIVQLMKTLRNDEIVLSIGILTDLWVILFAA